MALRRKPRGVGTLHDHGESFVRLDGTDGLQYRRGSLFNADAGELRMRIRLRELPGEDGSAVLFNVGVGVPGGGPAGMSTNAFALGVFDGAALRFAVRSNRMHEVRVDLPEAGKALADGRWHDLAARWGGLNASKSRPFMAIELDGRSARMADAAVFGEMITDAQGLTPRSTPRPFHVTPRTVLAFGSAVQIPGVGATCDLARIELRCPGRRALVIDPSRGLGPEDGGGPMGFKLHPVELSHVAEDHALIGAGSRRVKVLALPPHGARFTTKRVPWAASGFAATSLRILDPTETQPATRLLVEACDDRLMLLLFVDAGATVRCTPNSGGFELQLGRQRHRFACSPRGGAILRRQ